MRRPGRLIFLLALSPRRRLEDALKTLDCIATILQFRALSDQLYQSPDHHEFVREQIINQVTNGIKFRIAIPSPMCIFPSLL
jgi:hypothetical protein